MAIVMTMDYGQGMPKVMIDDSCIQETEETAEAALQSCYKHYCEGVLLKIQAEQDEKE